MKLRTLPWNMEALDVSLRRAAFFKDDSRFPRGSVEFDCGLIIRCLPHEWHEIKDIPEMAAVSG